MELAAFQLSYLQSNSSVCIKRNEKWSKETEDIKEASGHSGQSLRYSFLFFLSLTDFSVVPQVANQTFHRIADFLSCFGVNTSVSSFTLFPGEEPGIRFLRAAEGIHNLCCCYKVEANPIALPCGF